jgi:hypothetical protein
MGGNRAAEGEVVITTYPVNFQTWFERASRSQVADGSATGCCLLACVSHHISFVLAWLLLFGSGHDIKEYKIVS